MTWDESCQQEIDRLIATQSLSEVIAKAVSGIAEGYVDSHHAQLGNYVSCDPKQVIDFNQRLLCAAIDEILRQIYRSYEKP